MEYSIDYDIIASEEDDVWLLWGVNVSGWKRHSGSEGDGLKKVK